MVTGDHATIAKQVAGQTGMGAHVREAGDLFKEEKEETHLDEEVINADTFAQEGQERKTMMMISIIPASGEQKKLPENRAAFSDNIEFWYNLFIGLFCFSQNSSAFHG